MLHVNIHKNGNTLYCEAHTVKPYKWEGDSDFADIDIPAVSWSQLLERMEWSDITDMSIIRFLKGKEITFSQFRNKVVTDSASLDAMV